MNDIEWQQYLATLPKELADLAGHIMERINTVVSRERNRAFGEHQEIHQRIDVKQTKLADLRTIVRDLAERLQELEKAVNDDASNAAGSQKP
jgi:hypothetical protein